MNIDAMKPYDQALWDLYCGKLSSSIITRREDGLVDEMEMEMFLRGPDRFSLIEHKALALCRGKVLDAGAGAGNHSLELQRRGLEVLAIDVAPHAVEIMQERGVRDVQCIDFFELQASGFDTLLLMMHGIGLVETLQGLDRFLEHARALLQPDGIIILDSLDVRGTTETRHLKYLAAKQIAGQYMGELCLRFEYKDLIGEYFHWLHVDPETLTEHAARHGWQSTIVHQEADGDYLVFLSRKR